MTTYETAQAAAVDQRFRVFGNTFVQPHTVTLRQHWDVPSLFVAETSEGDNEVVSRKDIQYYLDIGWWQLPR